MPKRLRIPGVLTILRSNIAGKDGEILSRGFSVTLFGKEFFVGR